MSQFENYLKIKNDQSFEDLNDSVVDDGVDNETKKKQLKKQKEERKKDHAFKNYRRKALSAKLFQHGFPSVDDYKVIKNYNKKVTSSDVYKVVDKAVKAQLALKYISPATFPTVFGKGDDNLTDGQIRNNPKKYKSIPEYIQDANTSLIGPKSLPPQSHIKYYEIAERLGDNINKTALQLIKEAMASYNGGLDKKGDKITPRIIMTYPEGRGLFEIDNKQKYLVQIKNEKVDDSLGGLSTLLNGTGLEYHYIPSLARLRSWAEGGKQYELQICRETIQFYAAIPRWVSFISESENRQNTCLMLMILKKKMVMHCQKMLWIRDKYGKKKANGNKLQLKSSTTTLIKPCKSRARATLTSTPKPPPCTNNMQELDELFNRFGIPNANNSNNNDIPQFSINANQSPFRTRPVISLPESSKNNKFDLPLLAEDEDEIDPDIYLNDS